MLDNSPIEWKGPEKGWRLTVRYPIIVVARCSGGSLGTCCLFFLTHFLEPDHLAIVFFGRYTLSFEVSDAFATALQLTKDCLICALDRKLLAQSVGAV